MLLHPTHLTQGEILCQTPTFGGNGAGCRWEHLDDRFAWPKKGLWRGFVFHLEPQLVLSMCFLCWTPKEFLSAHSHLENYNTEIRIDWNQKSCLNVSFWSSYFHWTINSCWTSSPFGRWFRLRFAYWWTARRVGTRPFFFPKRRQFRGIGSSGIHRRFFIGENGGVLAPWDGTVPFNHQPQWVKQLGLPSFNHHFPYDMCKIPNFCLKKNSDSKVDVFFNPCSLKVQGFRKM